MRSQDQNARTRKFESAASTLGPITVQAAPLSPLQTDLSEIMADKADPQQASTADIYSFPVQKAISLGNKEYALKNYEKAVEHYGGASELQ